ncbi:ABC transporter substrate-binding protein [Pseudoduganella violacea]|uniref:Putative ABC transport system substrate-binding protein n=1 Tax=Pseudoduganella violacea TaxID=1715466 RepID=A0A7W5FW18_9BURK|nr:ABC transporter substrate binding protein [Pseudoduganella violacea]MBB3121417.1 putative ABC transport system substrate-binding protein [Pseudoduganella violacea]
MLLSSNPAQAELAEGGERQAAAESIAVVYPDIGEPYRKVFTEIIGGIEDETRMRVRGYPVGPHADLGELRAQLRRSGSKLVIALGRQGVKAASGADLAFGMVVGGISSAPDSERLRGITLSPDPALLFSHLKALLPSLRRITVVYNPQNNHALIKLAQEAARNQGLDLQALEAADLAAAVRRYEQAFASADNRYDALWLPQDNTTVDEAIIVPMVLKESWNRGLPIFSSSMLHVKKGVLFALYPNNFELGRELANLAVDVLNGDNTRQGLTPLRSVRSALNWRTANHIGLNLDPGRQRNFDTIFPEP